MQITIKGEMSLEQVAQAIYEQLGALQLEFAIAHSQGATLYVNPSDGKGRLVLARRRDGSIVTKIVSNGPYRSAADEFNI